MAKNKILICWNQTSYADILKQQITSKDYELVVCTDFQSLEKIVREDENLSRYKAIIVLCELTWSERTQNNPYTELSGIELVQHYFRVKKEIKLPILFVSFLKRKHILTLDSSKEIVNAKGLQHEFKQLPSPLDEWINTLREMDNLTELEFIDVLHFCTIGDMAAEIRHDAIGRNLLKEELKLLVLKIRHLIKDAVELTALNKEITEVEALLEKDDLSAIENKIKEICDTIETNVKRDKNHQDELPETTNPIKVLWLEDEPDTIKKITENENAKSVFIFTIVTTPDEFSSQIERDEENKFSIIICDNRIKGNDIDDTDDDTPVLLEQGYTCMRKLVEKHPERYYKYVLLSELPRNFKIKIAEDFRFNVINKSKSKDFANPNEFVYFIRKESDKLQDAIGKKGFTNSNFIRFYTYIKTIKRNDIPPFHEIEQSIIHRARALIKYYEDGKKYDKTLFYEDTVYIDSQLNIVKGKDKLNSVKYEECRNGIIHNVSISFAENKIIINELRKILNKIVNDMITIVKGYTLNSCSENLFKYNLLSYIPYYKDEKAKLIIEKICNFFYNYRNYKTSEIVDNIISNYPDINSDLKSCEMGVKVFGQEFKEKTYVYQDETLENIEAFISKLVARRVALYIYLKHKTEIDNNMKKKTNKEKMEINEKPYTLEKLYGFFGKDRGFGSHDLDLNFRENKDKKQTIEEKRFFKEFFPHLQSSLNK
jgi:hypothetical protein